MLCRRATPILRSALRTAIAIASISGCTESPTGTRPAAPLVADAPSAAIGVWPAPSEFTWSQGQLAVNMGSATTKVCFLTRVQGKFRDVTEFVGTGVSLGRWYLGGTSQQTGVSAKARCVTASSYSAEVAASTTSTVTLPLTGLVCGLTGVGGRFKFDNDQVRITSSAGGWRLRVVNASDYSTSGRARCITSPTNVTSGFTWHTGDGLQGFPVSAASTCFLTGIQGNLAGSAFWAWVFKYGSWYLTGGSNITVNTAWASCAG